MPVHDRASGVSRPSGHGMVKRSGAMRWITGCAAFTLLVGACGSGDATTSAGTGSLSAFCDLLMVRPPTDAFRDPGNETARGKLDEYLARATEFAPDDIRAEVVTYRQSVGGYLDALKKDLPRSKIDAAQHAQERAGDVVNRFVDDHCDSP